jgi:acyl carrier protein
MEQNDISKKLTSVFHAVFDDESIILKPEMTAADIEEWDSLTHIRLILSVEKEFGVKFSAAEVGNLKNVGDFLSLIESKL